MTEYAPLRAYNVNELAALRAAVKSKVQWGWYSHPPPPKNPDGSYKESYSYSYASQPYKSGELETVIEQMVRTHMVAGHSAEDLYMSESWYAERVKKKAEGE